MEYEFFGQEKRIHRARETNLPTRGGKSLLVQKEGGRGGSVRGGCITRKRGELRMEPKGEETLSMSGGGGSSSEKKLIIYSKDQRLEERGRDILLKAVRRERVSCQRR